eukprot:6839950-Alexandrium_andersonii.AAC.1
MATKSDLMELKSSIMAEMRLSIAQSVDPLKDATSIKAFQSRLHRSHFGSSVHSVSAAQSQPHSLSRSSLCRISVRYFGSVL